MAIEQMQARGYTPKQVWEQLKSTAPDKGFPAPPLRTIQNIMARARRANGSMARGEGVWTLDALTVEETREVLNFLASHVQRVGMEFHSDGQPLGLLALTLDEARMIARLSVLCRPLVTAADPLTTLEFARLYLARLKSKSSTDDLDAFLGFRPWESERRAHGYWAALDWAFVPSPPPFLAGLVKLEWVKRWVDEVPVLKDRRSFVVRDWLALYERLEEITNMGKEGLVNITRDEALLLIRNVRATTKEDTDGTQG